MDALRRAVANEQGYATRPWAYVAACDSCGGLVPVRLLWQRQLRTSVLDRVLGRPLCAACLLLEYWREIAWPLRQEAG